MNQPTNSILALGPHPTAQRRAALVCSRPLHSTSTRFHRHIPACPADPHTRWLSPVPVTRLSQLWREMGARGLLFPTGGLVLKKKNIIKHTHIVLGKY